MNARPLSAPPFYALEVRPGITFTYGGLAVDEHARALDPAGEPVPGLLVAGANAGNIYRSGYAGGLALAGTFGFRAAMQVRASRSWQRVTQPVRRLSEKCSEGQHYKIGRARWHQTHANARKHHAADTAGLRPTALLPARR